MVRLEDETSNSLFEVLSEWEALLQAENIDVFPLSEPPDGSNDPEGPGAGL